jgi:DNA-binding XRE family transcriptional regulator
MNEMSIHPLQKARKQLGLKQHMLAGFTGLSIPTIKRAESGKPLNAYSIAQICEYFSLQYKRKVEPAELGLHEGSSMTDNRSSLPLLESNDFFSFGNLETPLIVLDGNGMETYSPQNIHTFYDFRPVNFIEEIEQMKTIIEKEQLQNEINGKPLQWNGDIYHLARCIVSRESIHEHMKLNLWFHPTDYYTVLGKNRCLKENSFREKYVVGYDWEISFPPLPIPFGIGLSLLTRDGYILFAQRGGTLGVRPGYFMTSVEEGLSRPLDRSTISDAPDVYRCACRGLFEELGLIENADFSVSDILFLSFGLDTEYYMCGLRGLMKLQNTANEIIKNWQIGVKDKLENKKFFAIPFTPQDVCEFVFSHSPWGGGALMGIYHTLVHEFGRKEVDKVLSSY